MVNSQCSILIRTERTTRNPTSTSAENCALGIEHWSDPVGHSAKLFLRKPLGLVLNGKTTAPESITLPHRLTIRSYSHRPAAKHVPHFRLPTNHRPGAQSGLGEHQLSDRCLSER